MDNSRKKQSFKQNFSYTIWSILSNSSINQFMLNLLTAIECLFSAYYCIQMHQNLSLKARNSQLSAPTTSSYIRTDIFSTIQSYLNKQSSSNNLYFLIFTQVMSLIYLAVLTHILVLTRKNSTLAIKQLSKQSCGKKITMMTLVLLKTAFFYPVLELTLRSFQLTAVNGLSISVLYIVLNMLSLLMFLLIVFTTHKILTLGYPSASVIWSKPSSKALYLQILTSLAPVSVIVFDSNHQQILIEVIFCFALFMLNLLTSLLFVSGFNKIECYMRELSFLANFSILASSIISYAFQETLGLDFILIPVIFIVLALFGIKVKNKFKGSRLRKFMSGSMKSELEVEQSLCFILEIAEKAKAQVDLTEDDLDTVQRFIESHSLQCDEEHCICQVNEQYLKFLEQENLQNSKIIKVNSETFKEYQEQFKRLKGKRDSIWKLDEMMDKGAIQDVKGQSQAPEQIYQNQQDLTSLPQQSLRLTDMKVDIKEINRDFITSFFNIYFKKAAQSLPKSQRILNLSLYYSLFIQGNELKSMVELMKFDYSALSFFDSVNFYSNELCLIDQFIQIQKEKENAEFSSKVDSEHFVQLNKLVNLFSQSLDQLSQDTIDLWKGFGGENLNVEQQRVYGSKISFQVKRAYSLFKDIEQMRKQRDFKIYYWFAQIQLLLLNDQEGYNIFIGKMKSILQINTIIYQNLRYQEQVEDAGFVIVNSKQCVLGRILFINQSLRKALEWTADDGKRMNLKDLMPGIIAKSHDQFFQKFTEKGRSEIMDRSRMVFFKTKKGHLTPAELEIKFYFSQEYGHTFLGIAQFSKMLSPFRNQEQIRANQLFYLVFNSTNGQLQESSKNFIDLINSDNKNKVQAISSLQTEERLMTLSNLLPNFDSSQLESNIKERKNKKNAKGFYLEKQAHFEAETILKMQVFNENYSEDLQNRLHQMFKSKNSNLMVKAALFQESYCQGICKINYLVFRPLYSTEMEDGDQVQVFKQPFIEEINNLQEEINQEMSSKISSGDSQQSNSQEIYMRNFHAFSQLRTPRSLKSMIQIVIFAFLSVFCTSSINMIINITSQSQQSADLMTIQQSFELLNYHAINKIVVRVLLNIANGYEPNSTWQLGDRFQTYKDLQVTAIEHLRQAQNYLDNNQKFKSSLKTNEMRKAKVVSLEYLQDDGTIIIQNETMTVAQNIFSGKLTDINNMTRQELKGNLYIQSLTPNRSSQYQPTQTEKTIFFAVKNANEAIRMNDEEFMDQYMTDAQSHSASLEIISKLVTLLAIGTIFFVSMSVLFILVRVQKRKYQALIYFLQIPLKIIQSCIQNCEKCQNLFNEHLSVVESGQIEVNNQDAGDSEGDMSQNRSIKHENYSGSMLENDSHTFKSQMKLTSFTRKLTKQKLQSRKNQTQQIFIHGGGEEELKEDIDRPIKMESIHISYSRKITNREKNLASIMKNELKSANKNPSTLITKIQEEQIQISDRQNASVNESSRNLFQQSLHLKKNVPDQEEIVEMQQRNKKSINSHIRKSIFASTLTIVSLFIFFSSYFGIVYLLNENNFKNEIDSLLSIHIFTDQESCFDDDICFIREAQIRNESIIILQHLEIGEAYVEGMKDYLEHCYYIEEKYLNIRKNPPPYLGEAIDFIEKVEADTLCNAVYMGNYSNELGLCQKSLNGILTKGLSNTLWYMLQNNQLLINSFDSAGEAGKRDLLFLKSQLSDPQIIEIIDTKLILMQPLFQILKDKTFKSITDYFAAFVKKVIAVYLGFAFLLVLSLVYFLGKTVIELKETMWGTNMLLRIIPVEGLKSNEYSQLQKFFIN